MNTDFRVITTMPDHHKTEKLVRRAGEGAIRPLLRLWAYAAQFRPDGVFTSMDHEDLLIVARWHDDTTDLVAELVAVGFLDLEGDTYALHDWTTHNNWAAGSTERSKQARAAAKARWNGEKGTSKPRSKQARKPIAERGAKLVALDRNAPSLSFPYDSPPMSPDAAAEALANSVSTIGRNAVPQYQSDAMAAAVKACGGWLAWCDARPQDLGRLSRSFKTRYKQELG